MAGATASNVDNASVLAVHEIHLEGRTRRWADCRKAGVLHRQDATGPYPGPHPPQELDRLAQVLQADTRSNAAGSANSLTLATRKSTVSMPITARSDRPGGPVRTTLTRPRIRVARSSYAFGGCWLALRSWGVSSR